MVMQGISLPSSMYGSITSDLQRVASIYNRSQALGRNLANLDQQFNTQFTGYQSYVQRFLQSSGRATGAVDSPGHGQRQKRDGIGLYETSTFADEDKQFSQMMASSQSAVGRQQAIQAGN